MHYYTCIYFVLSKCSQMKEVYFKPHEYTFVFSVLFFQLFSGTKFKQEDSYLEDTNQSILKLLYKLHTF